MRLDGSKEMVAQKVSHYQIIKNAY